jgi:hypothetical protein
MPWRARDGVKDAVRVIAFFFGVCFLSCLFGAVLIGFLALLVA